MSASQRDSLQSPTRRVGRWLAGIIVGIGVAAGWMIAGEAIVRAYHGLDLTRVPTMAAPFSRDAVTREGWAVVRVRGMSLTAPAGLRHPKTAATPAGTAGLTDQKQTTWLSITLRRSRSRWADRWYRYCLYADREPLGLLGKALLVPPMGTPTPQILDQQLGPWHAYLYVATPRIAADLFDGRHHVTVIYTGRRDAAALETARAIMASLRVS